MAGRRTRNELGEAAQVVISHLTRIPQLEDSSIAVTGGFCLGHYAPDYRGTNNIDLLTTAEQAPKSVEERLLCIPDTPFEKSTRFFSYKNSSGNLVSINIIPYWQYPYRPEVVAVKSVEGGNLPYISPQDLLAFKIYSCGLKHVEKERRQDARDAMHLVDILTREGPLQLSSEQAKAIEEGLKGVVEVSRREESWWRQKLNLKKPVGLERNRLK